MVTTLKLAEVIISLMICMLPRAAANYILEVRTWSYYNPGSRLAGGQCCRYQNPGLSQLCQYYACSNRFYYCLRHLGSTEPGCSGGETSQINYNEAHIDFMSPTVLGLPNPLPLPGLTTEWRGVQFYLEANHTTSETEPGMLIGRVTFDIPYESLSIGIESGQMTFNLSFYGATAVNMAFSFRVVCAENYYGLSCSQFCKEGCTWDSEFTGESCNEIDNCLGVDCGKNGQCVDGIDNYTCICYPGYAAKNCDVNVCHVLNITSSLEMVQTFNLKAMLTGIIGVLVLVILLLLVVGATCFAIRASKKRGNNHTVTDGTDTLELIPNPEEHGIQANYSLETEENICYRALPHATLSRDNDRIYYNVTKRMEDEDC